MIIYGEIDWLVPFCITSVGCDRFAKEYKQVLEWTGINFLLDNLQPVPRLGLGLIFFVVCIGSKEGIDPPDNFVDGILVHNGIDKKATIRTVVPSQEIAARNINVSLQ